MKHQPPAALILHEWLLVCWLLVTRQEHTLVYCWTHTFQSLTHTEGRVWFSIDVKVHHLEAKSHKRHPDLEMEPATLLLRGD